VAAIQVLLVTAHERRLALKRLERQADTDPQTNLLSLTGLYRKLEELGERVEDAGDTQISNFPQDVSHYKRALVSVQMTNADSIEQLLGSRKSDVLERATSGALTAIAPKVLWSRISKAHFVGLVNETGEDLEALLSKVNFAVVEAKSLLDENVRPPAVDGGCSHTRLGPAAAGGSHHGMPAQGRADCTSLTPQPHHGREPRVGPGAKA
jgi:GGDEF domain-containing protein